MAGSSPEPIYPSLRWWTRLFRALLAAFLDARLYVTGLSRGDGGRTTTHAFRRETLDGLFARFPRAVDCYDIGLANQLALLERHRAVEARGVEVELVVGEERRVDDQLQIGVERERQDRAGRAAGQPLGDRGRGERDVGAAQQRLDRAQVDPRVAGDHAEDVAGRLFADLDHQDDALGSLRERVAAHRADDLGASLGRVVDQAVARAVRVEQGDQSIVRVGVLGHAPPTSGE